MSNEIVAMVERSYATITTADGLIRKCSGNRSARVLVPLDWLLGYGRKAALKEEMQVGINATLYIKVLMMYNQH
jgi:molybdopterin-containing oxidoreductase family iron-sulfur binding subunit